MWWGIIRVGAVREGHERQERPVIVDCWVCAILEPEPALYLGASAKRKLYEVVRLGAKYLA